MLSKEKAKKILEITLATVVQIVNIIHRAWAVVLLYQKLYCVIKNINKNKNIDKNREETKQWH